jgi:hypothetical protein
MIVNANPVPYKPATLETSKATLTTHTAETTDGKIIGEQKVAAADWAWAKVRCGPSVPRHARSDADLRQGRLQSEAAVSGGVHLQRRVRARHRLSRHSATSRRFQVRGEGRRGNAEPVAGQVQWVVSRGQSQSGNMLRQSDRARLHTGRSEAQG